MTMSVSSSCTHLSNPISSRALLLWRTHQHISLLHRSNPKIKYSSSRITCGRVLRLEDIATFAENKVLVAAALSATIGQLLKPFTSVFLYQKPVVNFKAAVRAGGFPSTHSSTVVATAVSLGLERGFSDCIFGLAVVYATLVMYDAQGVRREVGKHAKTINKFIVKEGGSAGYLLSEEEEKAASSVTFVSTQQEGKANTDPESAVFSSVSDNELAGSYALNESIGHTELEVVAGAVLGFFVSLAVFHL